MLKESLNKRNKKPLSEPKNKAKEKIICKDGFCSLTNQKELSNQNTNDINLFDPI